MKREDSFLDTFALFFTAFVPMIYATAVPVSKKSLAACIVLSLILLGGSAWSCLQELNEEEERESKENEESTKEEA